MPPTYEPLADSPAAAQLGRPWPRRPLSARNPWFLVACILTIVAVSAHFALGAHGDADTGAGYRSASVRWPFDAAEPHGLSTLVGASKLASRPGKAQTCTAHQLLDAVARARVDPAGPAALPPANATFEPADFRFSFDLPGCSPPHVYSAAEACDLLENSFGGLLLRGDSLVRHLANALFIILRGRRDGAITKGEARDICWGDRMFDDKKNCREFGLGDSQDPALDAPVCGGNVFLHYEDRACPSSPTSYVARLVEWRNKMPWYRKDLSPVVVQSFGLHCKMATSVSLLGAVKPLLNFASTAFPAPLPLWLGIHAPGPNKPVQFAGEQGPAAVQRYNAAMRRRLDGVQPGDQALAEGRMGFLDYFGMTDGAKSFDGTHYMYQVNLEKAHLLLNYLDVLAREVQGAGGLFNLSDICPSGVNDYRCRQ
ncbi:hypothetical protein NBRC10512_004316 [Rhodotorula toruloides]|uniref:RHTO0S12e01596g1_1 n=2 Tax=Rhodotorula toruloides TaxID=5286 RepID=A0A061B8G0_RHOTO|nr:uncharacterized protein RHTO_07611 [Rhodotorula toruloides NP11]EMS23269.1 hypothetical protein RHTO_07611 [Rhodotorula toruloides NP11]CDR46207.1 RHTO0S12e01596g1_1 [Rhodotorula toruloides]